MTKALFLLFVMTIILFSWLLHSLSATDEQPQSMEALCFDFRDRFTYRDYADFMDAMVFVESGYGNAAIGLDGELGAYQIKEIYVDDVNRVIREDVFVYSDRLTRQKSAVMADIYMMKYAAAFYDWNPTSDIHPFEIMARIHNGGPNGYKKESTKPYWLKVKARMEDKKASEK